MFTHVQCLIMYTIGIKNTLSGRNILLRCDNVLITVIIRFINVVNKPCKYHTVTHLNLVLWDEFCRYESSWIFHSPSLEYIYNLFDFQIIPLLSRRHNLHQNVQENITNLILIL